MVLSPMSRIGDLREVPGEAPISGATWYEADSRGAGFEYKFPAGTLAGAAYLTADWLIDGNLMADFALLLQEGEGGAIFRMNFGFLPQCQARMRVPMEAVEQNRWKYPREGAWLDPLCWMDRVDLNEVDRMRIVLERKGPGVVRFCLTPVKAAIEAPPLLEAPVLPNGPLLDEMGQSTLHDWPEKTQSVYDLVSRMDEQRGKAPRAVWPIGFSRWGGSLEYSADAARNRATGFFHTYHDGDRWWLVDPDGFLFWSSGLDCVEYGITSAYGGIESALSWLPDGDGEFAEAHVGREGHAFDYLRANFIRAFGSAGAHAAWSEIALSQLREFGFNTVANWSDWRIAVGGVPYVRPMNGDALRVVPTIYRDFPDVYHPDFPVAADAFAAQLAETAGDPAFIGYFLMNEPNWGFATESPAAGMLYTTPVCHTRQALAGYLRDRYASDEALSTAWGLDVTLDSVAQGSWSQSLSEAARQDLATFSDEMVARYFDVLGSACRRVDPDHLNLGIRYYTIPPAWAVRGMRSFDVFSMNCYQPRVLADKMAQIAELLDMPIMVGEWHFGALDVGLPASGLRHVKDQIERGKAFRVYLEDAAAKPWCVGVHYFTLYDQSAIGRGDGEAYNIGFVDVCSRPYTPLAEAARVSHERLYQLANGEIEPYYVELEYLPPLML
jgi:hypothetical protein